MYPVKPRAEPHRSEVDPGERPTPLSSAVAERLRADPLLVERQGVLRRTLSGLSEKQLRALAAGLERNRGQLVSGRLFKSSGGGGCAVGVMLLELEAVPVRSGARFWLRDRWRRSMTSYRAVRSQPRLRHLEWSFDDAVERLRAAGADRAVAVGAVGAWLEGFAHSELAWRDLQRLEGDPR